MAGLNMSDMDAIFNGAGAVVDATQNVIGAISNGINQVQGAFDGSRRSVPAQPTNGYNYYQPVTYGYGYGGYGGYVDMVNNMPPQGIIPPQYQQQPSFGSMHQQIYSPSPTYPMTNGYCGYYGFSDPGYGSNGGGYVPPNGQKGGNFGWG